MHRRGSALHGLRQPIFLFFGQYIRCRARSTYKRSRVYQTPVTTPSSPLECPAGLGAQANIQHTRPCTGEVNGHATVPRTVAAIPRPYATYSGLSICSAAISSSNDGSRHAGVSCMPDTCYVVVCTARTSQVHNLLFILTCARRGAIDNMIRRGTPLGCCRWRLSGPGLRPTILSATISSNLEGTVRRHVAGLRATSAVLPPPLNWFTVPTVLRVPSLRLAWARRPVALV